MSGSTDGGSDLKASVSKLFKLQEERVRVYQQFDIHFSQYLESGPEYDFSQFRSHVHNITARFQELSEGVREVGNTLKVAGLSDAAALVAQLQENEKQKLELTAAWQLQRQAMVDANRELEEQRNAEADEDTLEEKALLAEHAKLESADLKHRTQAIITTIQDVLRDLRYELEDILLAGLEDS